MRSKSGAWPRKAGDVVRGFTLIEVVVAMAIMLAVTAGVFAAIQAAPERALAESEAADAQQRARVAVEVIERDAIGAIAVRPCRWGGASEDPPGTFRSDAATFVTTATTTTYWLKSDPLSQTFQLIQWSGGTSPDVPVVDHVVALRFDYLGDGGVQLADAVLSALRVVVVTVRVEAAVAAARGPAGVFFTHEGTARTPRQWAPDVEVQLPIAIRNLTLDR